MNQLLTNQNTKKMKMKKVKMKKVKMRNNNLSLKKSLAGLFGYHSPEKGCITFLPYTEIVREGFGSRGVSEASVYAGFSVFGENYHSPALPRQKTPVPYSVLMRT